MGEVAVVAMLPIFFFFNCKYKSDVYAVKLIDYLIHRLKLYALLPIYVYIHYIIFSYRYFSASLVMVGDNDSFCMLLANETWYFTKEW